MTRPIGYYVHHHGAGHLARASIIADHAGDRVTLIGTGLTGKTDHRFCLDLPDDRREIAFDGTDGEAQRPEALHYAPIDHEGVRQRVAAIAGWIAEMRPSLMVIDVSCEVAMLARLASVPTVVVRLGGCRNDPPHLQAFRAARAVVSPFSEVLEDEATPQWVREKTRYCPGIVHRAPPAAGEARDVLVVVGQGGATGDGAVWARAARTTPEWTWRVIGPCSPARDCPANLAILGWVDDAPARIARAAVVVGSAGDGIVGAVFAAGRPFICVPEDRPFGEQRSKAAGLVGAGAAILCDDAARAPWAALLADAQALDPEARAVLDDPRGADRFVTHLLTLADEGRA